MDSKFEARACLKAERSGWLRRFEVVSWLSREFLYLETSSLNRKFGNIWSAESRVKLHLGHLEGVWWITVVPSIWIPMHHQPAGLLDRLKKTVVAESVTTSERLFKQFQSCFLSIYLVMWASVIKSKQIGQMKSMLRSWPGTPDAEAPDDVPDEAPEDSDDDPAPGVEREGPGPGRGLLAGLGSPSDIVTCRVWKLFSGCAMWYRWQENLLRGFLVPNIRTTQLTLGKLKSVLLSIEVPFRVLFLVFTF